MAARSVVSAAITVAAVVGCDAGPILFSPPPVEGAMSMVLVFDRSAPTAVAMDLERPVPAAVALVGERVPIYAFTYRERLDQLGLEPGKLELVPGGRRLPDPLAAQLNVVDDGGESGWTAVADPRSLLDRFLVEGDPDPCAGAPEFDVVSYRLETRTNGRSVVPLDGESVLLTAADSTFYVLSKRALTRLPLPSDLPPTAFRAPDGELWFGGARGATRHGRIETGFLEVESASTAFELVDLGGPNREAPFELYAVDNGGGVHLSDGTRWRRLARGLPVIGFGIAWAGPGRAFVARHSTDSLLLIEDGVPREENPSGAALEVTAVGYSDTLGLAAGTSAGSLHLRREGEGWYLAGRLEEAAIRHIVAYEDLLVLGGTDGFIAFYRPGRGLCATQLLATDIGRLAVVGRDIAVSHPNVQWEEPELSPQPTVASWLVRRSRAND